MERDETQERLPQLPPPPQKLKAALRNSPPCLESRHRAPRTTEKQHKRKATAPRGAVGAPPGRQGAAPARKQMPPAPPYIYISIYSSHAHTPRDPCKPQGRGGDQNRDPKSNPQQPVPERKQNPTRGEGGRADRSCQPERGWAEGRLRPAPRSAGGQLTLTSCSSAGWPASPGPRRARRRWWRTWPGCTSCGDAGSAGPACP